jgi:hypothetical protein
LERSVSLGPDPTRVKQNTPRTGAKKAEKNPSFFIRVQRPDYAGLVIFSPLHPEPRVILSRKPRR